MTANGSVYLFQSLPNSTRPHNLVQTVWGPFSGDLFGSAVAMGDINGDQIDDILVGAPGSSGGNGAIYRIDNGAPQHLHSVTWARRFGSLLVCAKLGSDSHADIVTTGANELFALDGDTLSYIWQRSAPEAIDALAVLGDLNSDGFDEIAIGMAQHAQGRGLVQIYSGQDGSVWRTHAGASLGDALGIQIVGLHGDINGDGARDYAISAPEAANRGSVTFFSGADGATLTTRWGAVQGMRFGTSLACGGDANSDGYPDVLVGCPTTNPALNGLTELISGLQFGTLRMRTGTTATFGQRVASIDTFGDGRVDDVVSEIGMQSVWVFDDAFVGAPAFPGAPFPIPGWSYGFGAVCVASNGRLARASCQPSVPTVDRPLSLNLDSAPAGVAAVLLWGAPPAPAWLTNLRTALCSWQIDPLITISLVTDSLGRARWTHPSLAALTRWGYFQFVVLDLGQPGFYVPIVTSNGAFYKAGGY